jgi:hypothetical protein
MFLLRSSFGCATRSFKNLDNFLGAIEMVAEDADGKIVEKKIATSNAQSVKFPLGEKESTATLDTVFRLIQLSFPSMLAVGMSLLTSLLQIMGLPMSTWGTCVGILLRKRS